MIFLPLDETTKSGRFSEWNAGQVLDLWPWNFLAFLSLLLLLGVGIGLDQPMPENDADVVGAVLDMVDETNEAFFQAFKATSEEDRVSDKGAQVAHICDRFWKARDQLEDAWLVTRGEKIVSLADSETRTYTLELVEMVEEDFDKPLLPSPKAAEPDVDRSLAPC